MAWLEAPRRRRARARVQGGAPRPHRASSTSSSTPTTTSATTASTHGSHERWARVPFLHDPASPDARQQPARQPRSRHHGRGALHARRVSGPPLAPAHPGSATALAPSSRATRRLWRSAPQPPTSVLPFRPMFVFFPDGGYSNEGPGLGVESLCITAGQAASKPPPQRSPPQRSPPRQTQRHRPPPPCPPACHPKAA